MGQELWRLLASYFKEKAGQCPPLILPRLTCGRESVSVVPLKLIRELHAEHPWSKSRLRHHELRGVREQAGLRIGQVLREHMCAPRILGNPERGVISRVCRVFEAQQGRIDALRREGRIVARLGEGVAGVLAADLYEGVVATDRPVVARAQVKLDRR